MPLMNSWAVSGVVSVIYLGLFLRISRSDDPQSELLFGFCIAGLPISPNRFEGCHEDYRNSHAASFLLDSVMGWAVYYLHKRIQKRAHGTLNPKINLYFASMGSIIMFHGFLHLIMSEMFNCYIPPESIPMWLRTIGYIIVGVFSFMLCFVILGMSFGKNDGEGWKSVLVISLFLAGVVLALMMDRGLEWILPCLFSVSHPLACIAGFFSNSPLFTQAMGWTFLIASCMGILELTQCGNFYRGLGGHVLYDFWLHVTVLLSLPPFAPPVPSLTVRPAAKKCQGG